MMAKRPPVSPLMDVQTDAFATQYQQGVVWSMYGDEQGQGPVRDMYLVTNLHSCRARGYFDGQHDHWIPHIGFFLGMYHGGVLSPTIVQLRPDVTTLAVLTNQDARDGYAIRREDFFLGLDPHERRYTEQALLKQVRDVALESVHWKDSQQVWLYYVGCLLGELSGNLFPITEQDRLIWKQIDRRHQEASARWKASRERQTELLPVALR